MPNISDIRERDVRTQTNIPGSYRLREFQERSWPEERDITRWDLLYWSRRRVAWTSPFWLRSVKSVKTGFQCKMRLRAHAEDLRPLLWYDESNYGAEARTDWKPSLALGEWHTGQEFDRLQAGISCGSWVADRLEVAWFSWHIQKRPKALLEVKLKEAMNPKLEAIRQ